MKGIILSVLIGLFGWGVIGTNFVYGVLMGGWRQKPGTVVVLGPGMGKMILYSWPAVLIGLACFALTFYLLVGRRLLAR